MSGVQWFNAITLAVAAALAVTLGVVCIFYLVWIDAAPRLRAEWPTVRAVTGVFAAIALAAGAAFVGERRGAAWRLPAELALLATLGLGGLALYRTLT